MSNSGRPHRQQFTRLPCPWDSPGKNTGVGCHCLLQCMKVKSESEVAQLCQTLQDPMDCSLPGSSIHGRFQARVLEEGAIAFSEKTYIESYIYVYIYIYAQMIYEKVAKTIHWSIIAFLTSGTGTIVYPYANNELGSIPSTICKEYISKSIVNIKSKAIKFSEKKNGEKFCGFD